jgi:adenylyl- and sulfurtransferase ThiI
MPKLHIVVHYHELWLKGGNRRFFLGKLITAVKKALEGTGLERLHCPGDRILIELREDARFRHRLFCRGAGDFSRRRR